MNRKLLYIIATRENMSNMIRGYEKLMYIRI